MNAEQVTIHWLFLLCAVVAFANSYSKSPLNGDPIGSRIAAGIFLFFAEFPIFMDPAQ